jgi:predicted small secreted protein
MNKGFVLLIVLAMTVFLTGCGTTQTVGKTFIGGTEGLRATFLPGSPPTTITDGGTSGFAIVVKLENIGETSVKSGDGYIQIQGIDKQIYNSKESDFKELFSAYSNKAFGPELLGARRGFDGKTLNGGIGTVSFEDLKYTLLSQGDTPQTVVADVCYKYATKAVTQLCVKNSVEQSLGSTDICTVEGEKNPQNSGGPIQVTSLKESYAGTDKIGITLTLSHEGSGSAFFKYDTLDCNNVPSNMDKGKVKVVFEDVQVAGNKVPVKCDGMDSEGYVRLYGDSASGNKESYNLYCTIDTNGNNNVVEVPLNVELDYTYLQSIKTSLTIRHVTK